MARNQEEQTAKPTNDAYTGMLAVALLALIAGCVVLWLDYSQYPATQPPRFDYSFKDRPAFDPGKVKEEKPKDEIPDEVPEKKDNK